MTTAINHGKPFGDAALARHLAAVRRAMADRREIYTEADQHCWISALYHYSLGIADDTGVGLSNAQMAQLDAAHGEQP